MPEIILDKKIFSLLEVTRSIQKTLSDRYASSFWIKAEMNKLNYYSHSGHCYPELVEKVDGKVVAQMRSTLWADDFKRVNASFLKVLKEPLKEGIKIFFLARVKFDPSYGLSLHILDIDPSFTLGDLEKEKQETIDRLKKENLYDRNKKNILPLLPQRLAIISVETSKGYADFMEVIENNPWGYKFFHMLFPAILQGENAIESINFQLSQIEKVKHHFDLVAIIRGGGGDVGLSCYNNYVLAKNISMFPLPILTGIGHATNETVSEMVSFQNSITPTKLAEFLLQQFHQFANPVNDAREIIIRESRNLLTSVNSVLQSEARLFRSITGNLLLKNNNRLNTLSGNMIQTAVYTFRKEREWILDNRLQLAKSSQLLFTGKHRDVIQSVTTLQKDVTTNLKTARAEMLSLEKNILNMSPESVLKRGYSITLLNGKVVKSIRDVKPEDRLITQILDGNIASKVESLTEKKI